MSATDSYKRCYIVFFVRFVGNYFLQKAHAIPKERISFADTIVIATPTVSSFVNDVLDPFYQVKVVLMNSFIENLLLPFDLI